MGSDTWNEAPSVTDGAGWKAEGAAGGDAGGAADDGWTGGISEQNVSKHADGFDAPADGGCRNCGADTHFARDCPEPRVERAFTGTCLACGAEGHRKADCPNKPADKCKICGDEGHDKDACTANRLLMAMEGLKVDDPTLDTAWAALATADSEKEVEDIKKAIITYATTYPELTFTELETAFRENKMNTHLIAKQQEVSDTHTIVNLQGKIDQKYVISIQFGAKPRRAKFAEGWPQTPEENMDRLEEAGFVMDRMVQKCSNCNSLGHEAKSCPEEKQEKTKIVITCANCSEEGHYARDCKQPRKSSKKGCNNCGQEGHISKECPEPRSAEGVECKNCGEMGHFSKDCPSRAPDLCFNCGESGHRKSDCTNERRIQCRNCDEWGSHSAKECPKPRDYSRVQCLNCQKYGHTRTRCKEPPKEEDDGAAGGDGGGWGEGGAAANGTADVGGDGWGAAPAAASGGW